MISKAYELGRMAKRASAILTLFPVVACSSVAPRPATPVELVGGQVPEYVISSWSSCLAKLGRHIDSHPGVRALDVYVGDVIDETGIAEQLSQGGSTMVIEAIEKLRSNKVAVVGSQPKAADRDYRIIVGAFPQFDRTVRSSSRGAKIGLTRFFGADAGEDRTWNYLSSHLMMTDDDGRLSYNESVSLGIWFSDDNGEANFTGDGDEVLAAGLSISYKVKRVAGRHQAQRELIDGDVFLHMARHFGYPAERCYEPADPRFRPGTVLLGEAPVRPASDRKVADEPAPLVKAVTDFFGNLFK